MVVRLAFEDELFWPGCGPKRERAEQEKKQGTKELGAKLFKRLKKIVSVS
jgi:hypothetical protein